jgi:colicin import membrane protein
MATRRTHRAYSIVLSVLAHAALVVALTFSVPLATPQRPGTPNVEPIQAVMVSESDLAAERARIEAEQEAALREQREREDQIERERIAEQQRVEAERQAAAEAQREVERQAADAERIRIQQEQAEQEQIARLEQERLEQEAAEQAREEQEAREREEARLREEEQRRQEELARQQAAEEERLRREAEVRARAAADAVLAAAAEEEAARAAIRQAEESGVKDQWLLQITNRIERYWKKPASAQPGIVCILNVNWLISGDVISVNVAERECNGDDTVRRSIENAVLDASPLPPPPVPGLFDRNLRIRFAPE